MKHNKDKYEEVKTLPKNAKTVREYAESMDFTTSHVYNLIRKGKAKFKIVTFQSINFVVSSTKK